MHLGDAANEHRVPPTYSAPGAACDGMIVVLKLITNLVKGNSFGVRVQSLAEGGESRLAEALATLTSVDNAGAVVTMGELGRDKSGARNSLSKVMEYNEAFVIEGEEV